MNTKNEPNLEAGAAVVQEADAGIVSVNSRGATSNELGKKIFFIAVIAALVIIGGLWTVNHWRASNRSEAERLNAANKNETKPAQVGFKRTFEEPARPAETPKSAASAVAAPCKDVMVLDAKGLPVLGANGQAISVGCDGKVVVPAIAGAGPGAGAPGGAQQPPPKPPSRYAGDVLILAANGPTSGMGTAGAAPQGSGATAPANRATPADVLPILKTLLEQQQRVGAPAAQAGQGGGVERMQTPGGPPGGVFQAQGATPAAGAFPVAQAAPAARPPNTDGGAGGIANSQGAVGSLLTPTPTPKVTAAMLGDRNMVLAKGTHIDCALTVKVVNEVSGFASCVIPQNIFSDNGKVLLMERASEVQGEYTAMVRQGQRRLFVLWDRVKTPNGIVIAVGSPAGDSLGTMGIDGYVDNRWWDRLGAAFMLSMVKDLIGYQIAKDSGGANSNAGGLIYQNSVKTGESMAERILSQTINIQPTIYKNQGDLASIYVARDLDFSTVYALRAN